MKASEALLLGSVESRQGFGTTSLISETNPCALGTIRLAAGIRMVGSVQESLAPILNHFPILARKDLCPGCREDYGLDWGIPQRIADIVWHLNDSHRWTRPAIADWLKEMEVKHESNVPVPTQEVACAAS